MLYGNHSNHPWEEDMFPRPDLIQEMLDQEGLAFHVGCVVHGPTGKDELPSVRIAEDPVYDHKGILAEAHFRPGCLTAYPAIIDHWVANFQDEITHADGGVERVAYGVGLPPERLINHKNVQYFGNRKDHMHTILQEYGIEIDTWSVREVGKLAAKYGNQWPVIYKPLGGSQSKGIAKFESSKEVLKALEAGKLLVNGLVQPLYDVTPPIEGLVPLDRHNADVLRQTNAKSDRAREVRMYVTVTTDEDGQRHAEAYPMLKLGEPGSVTLPFHEAVMLHPDSFPPESYVYQKTVAAARLLAHKSQVPYLYGAMDWIKITLHDESEPSWRVGDFNCRGPGLLHEAIPARRSFAQLLTTMAKQNLRSHSRRELLTVPQYRPVL